jgi:hypothetical protein
LSLSEVCSFEDRVSAAVKLKSATTDAPKAHFVKQLCLLPVY